VDVFFNPESLDLTLTNTIQKGQRRRPAQTVTESTGKLSMVLIFDTTMNGRDVREDTHKVAQMMDPVQSSATRGGQGQERKIPSIVVFEWATVKFEGYIDSYKETIDFFSDEGVPLRATVDLSLTQQERTFAPNTGADYDSSGVLGQPAFGEESSSGVGSPTAVPDSDVQTMNMGAGETLTQAAQAAGDPGAARRLATQNGIENMRMPGVDEIAVADGPSRGAAGIGVGFSTGGTASAGFSASAAFNTQTAGLSTATGSAFAGLNIKASAQIPRPRVKLSLGIDSPPGVDTGIGIGTDFGAGGEIKTAGGGSMSADVGIDADFEAGITFED
jgi:hypothetical protein